MDDYDTGDRNTGPSYKRRGLNLQSGERGTAEIKELFEGLKSVISH